MARICRLKNKASTKTCLSTGLVNHLGSIAGGWNGSSDWIKHVPREKGCMTETVRLPALLLIISYAAVVVLANRVANDCFCAAYPAMIVESSPVIRKSVGLWSVALRRIIAELLVINGKGLKARAFGDPAVQGPTHMSRTPLKVRQILDYQFCQSHTPARLQGCMLNSL